MASFVCHQLFRHGRILAAFFRQSSSATSSLKKDGIKKVRSSACNKLKLSITFIFATFEYLIL